MGFWRRSAITWAIAMSLFGCAAGGDEEAGDRTPFRTIADSPSPISPKATDEDDASSWPDTVQRVQSGVVRISATGCDWSGLGSGFLIRSDLVVTAAHVVEDSIGVSVSAGMETSDAEVIGLASEADIALLQATQPLSGHVFQFAEEQPVLAQDVAALGYPLDADLTFTSGRVSGLDREIDRGRYVIDGLLQTDAVINPGNSGGPLVNIAGEVVGVVSSKRLWVIGTADEDDISVEGTGYAVAASTARQAAAELLESDIEDQFESCDDDPIPGNLIEVTVTSDHADAPGVAQSLLVHGQAINNGAYEIAFDIFTEEMGKRLGGLEEWSSGLDTSYWRELSVDDVAEIDGGLTADVALRTEQAAEFGRDGQTCSDWSLRYSLTWDEGLWRIDGVSLPRGDPTPCE